MARIAARQVTFEAQRGGAVIGMVQALGAATGGAMVALMGILLLAQGSDLQLILIFMLCFGAVAGVAEFARQARILPRKS